MLEVYIDGSSRGNPGKGGYGVVVLRKKCECSKYELVHSFSKQFDNVTNNQMELMAMIYAIEYLKDKEEAVIYCDSAYVVNTCQDWIWKWSQNGWRNSKGVEVENYAIMLDLYDALTSRIPNYKIKKIKGHNGEIGNEIADALATADIKKYQKYIDTYLFNFDK